MCPRLCDATAAKWAGGYYWPAGLLWRPVESEMGNICEVFFKRFFLIVALAPVISSALMINVDFLFTLFPNVGKWGTKRFNSFIDGSAASAQSWFQQTLFLCQSAGTRGLCPWKAGEPGEAFNPCPLTAPSLHGFPLYMDMFCFNSSFLLAALSVALRGTHSLFIGTYLGKGRNPMFLSNP